MNGVFDQSNFTIRCEWGEKGVAALAPISDVVIIVDVLSFSTSVDLLVSQSCRVYPYVWNGQDVRDYAKEIDAQVADRYNPEGYSLSPMSLERIPHGSKWILPSPNGSTLTLLAKPTPTFCAGLRNAAAVAASAMQMGERIAVIPCGERWHDDMETMRPCVEDLLGAGAVISHFRGKLSPEAKIAKTAFEGLKDRLHETILNSCSGLEKMHKQKSRDVELATQVDVSSSVPLLKDGAYEVISS